ncbi:MAG: hypothetical protein QOK44_4967, partial [Betaproteobacteria bacterium]|nr:hypothetical protein [Betaproteobacteria bacterium]
LVAALPLDESLHQQLQQGDELIVPEFAYTTFSHSLGR